VKEEADVNYEPLNKCIFDYEFIGMKLGPRDALYNTRFKGLKNITHSIRSLEELAEKNNLDINIPLIFREYVYSMRAVENCRCQQQPKSDPLHHLNNDPLFFKVFH